MKIKIDRMVEMIVHNIPNPAILTNGKKLLIANKSFLDLIGVSSIEEFNATHDCISDLFQEQNGFFSSKEIDTGESWTDYLYHRPERQRIVSLINYAGQMRFFEITFKETNHQSEYIIEFHDITAYISEKDTYKYYAYHDHLTRIYNRQKFDELFLKELENKNRYGDHLSIILMDIDHFKKVNDIYGHLVGDKVLIFLTLIVAENLRINDIFARWGGEEFIILLPRTNLDNAYEKAEELRQIVESYENHEIPRITISLGVTEVIETDDMLTCLQRVDKALFMAKKNRNEVVKLTS